MFLKHQIIVFFHEPLLQLYLIGTRILSGSIKTTPYDYTNKHNGINNSDDYENNHNNLIR